MTDVRCIVFSCKIQPYWCRCAYDDVSVVYILIKDFTVHNLLPRTYLRRILKKSVSWRLLYVILLTRFLDPATSYAIKVQGFTSLVDIGPFSPAINVTTLEDRKFYSSRSHVGLFLRLRPVESHSGARENFIAGPAPPSHSVCLEIETPSRGRKRGERCPLTIRLGVRGAS